MAEALIGWALHGAQPHRGPGLKTLRRCVRFSAWVSREGLLRQLGFWGNQYHDMTAFSLLRQDWAARPRQAGFDQ